MVVNVNFRKMETSPATKAYCLKKSEKLLNFFHGKVSVEWTLEVKKQQSTAHCHVKGKGIDLFAEGEGHDMQEAIDLAKAKMVRQIQKYKEKVTDHQGLPHGDVWTEATAS